MSKGSDGAEGGKRGVTVEKWMQFAVACRQIAAKRTGRRTAWPESTIG